MTDDLHVSVHAARWGIQSERCTKGQPVKERTAALAWQMLDRIDLSVFLWNVYPLHPHEADRPFTNRSHRASERAAGEEILSELLLLLRPVQVVAIGGDAARSAERIAPASTVRVRHPSYGGQSDFLGQISDLYGLRPDDKRDCDLFDRSCASRRGLLRLLRSDEIEIERVDPDAVGIACDRYRSKARDVRSRAC